MNIFRVLFFFLFLLFIAHLSFSQQPESPVRSFDSRAEQQYDLLEQSRLFKTQAIVAAATGPVLTGVGLYLLGKESSVSVSGTGSAGWISPRQGNSTAQFCGTLLASAGALTTISIIPLFIKSAKAKKKATLLLSDQSTGFLRTRISVPSFGLQLHF